MQQNIDEVEEYTFKDFDASYIQELANKNNFKYSARTKSHDIESSLYNNPESSTNEIHKLDMVIDNLSCEYYTANWRPWSLPDELESHFLVQVFAITLPYEVESLYIESRTNLNFNNVIGLPSIVFDDSDTVTLEGDFNYFFRVYASKNQKLSAFTILAPNIMVRMLEKGSSYDFEFAKNKIYFYQTFTGSMNNTIMIDKNNYDRLLNFGIESARIMARAARPTKIEHSTLNKAIWQLYNIKSSKKLATITQVTLVSLVTFPLVVLLMALVSVLRPFLAAIVIFVFIKYEIFKLKRKHLIQRWGNNYQNLNLIKK